VVGRVNSVESSAGMVVTCGRPSLAALDVGCARRATLDDGDVVRQLDDNPSVTATMGGDGWSRGLAWVGAIMT